MSAQTEVSRENIDSRITKLEEQLNIPERHKMMIAVTESIFPRLEGLSILDIACGHNFPIFSWLQDNNSGPLLAGYFASKGAAVSGLDILHFRRDKLFEKYPFKKIRGQAEEIRKYFEKEQFDLVTSCAFFGYCSSKDGRRPSSITEWSIMKQARDVTKQGGYGIHLLIDGDWQLKPEDLESLGYKIIKYLGNYAENFKMQEKPIGYDNIIIVQKI